MEDQKLEWMYRNSNDVADTEEYLLGKPIDKAFEQNSLGNEIEKDCLPTSIFAHASSNIQVDVIRKMKEDPLEVIRQQEIERRKQLLKNPVKLKKLQNMLKAKQSLEEKDWKESKKKSKLSSGDESQDIDSLLSSKYRSLMKTHRIKSLADLTSKKIHKKKKKKKAHFESSDSESDTDERQKKNKKPSKSKMSNSSEPDRKKYHKDDIRAKRKKYATSESSDSDSDFDKSLMKKKKALKNKSYSSESDCADEKRQKFKHQRDNAKSNRKKQTSSGSSDSDSEPKGKSHKRYHENNKKSMSFSTDGNRNSEKQRNKRIDDDPESSGSDKNCNRKSKNKQENSKSQRKNSKSRLDDGENVLRDKRYGLQLSESLKHKSNIFSEEEGRKTENKTRQNRSKSPPQKKLMNDSSRHQKHSDRDSKQFGHRDYKGNQGRYRDRNSKGLSEKEKQKRLEEMMSNAKWRDDLRVKNVTRYKKEDSFENKEKEYNEDFMRKQMAVATSSGSVEARIKSNINNIQRSKFSMSENFARR